MKQHRNNIISIHIDNMAIYASNGNSIAQTEKELEQAFEISRLGDIKFSLGWRYTETGTLTQLCLLKSKYIIKILHAAGMENYNVVATPMDLNIKLQNSPRMSPTRNKIQIPITCWWDFCMLQSAHDLTLPTPFKVYPSSAQTPDWNVYLL
jgi:hypothetical protein